MLASFGSWWFLKMRHIRDICRMEELWEFQ